MKKICGFILFILFSISVSSADFTVSYDFEEPTLTVRKDRMLLQADGCRPGGEPGEVLMPVRSIFCVLPPGETATDVSLHVEAGRLIPFMMEPLRGVSSRPMSQRPDLSIEKKKKRDSSSERIHWSIQTWKGIKILMGRIQPAVWNEDLRSAEFVSSITLKIHTENANVMDNRLNNRDRNFLIRHADNADMLNRYQPDLAPGAERCLIVTADSLVSVFDTLVTFYRRYGINCDVVTASMIKLTTDISGLDTQDEIRQFIYREYSSVEGLDYVILGGSDNIIPARDLVCSVESGEDLVESDNIPSDIYYAALDGSWDDNENGRYGEYIDTLARVLDEADLLPELAVGRYPGQNRQEIENLIKKVIQYQQYPVQDDLNKQLFFGEFLWGDPETWGADYLEMLMGTCDSNGYVTTGIPGNILRGEYYEREGSDWTGDDVIAACEEGAGMLHHSGHANVSSVMNLSYYTLSDSMLEQIDGVNCPNPLIITHGCNCGAFDYESAIGPAMVNSPYFAVGGLFNSRYGWFNEGTTEGPSQHLHREFLNALYGSGEPKFGKAHTICKIVTAPWVTAENQHEQNALRWNFYDQNLLGDPVMAIYGQTPVEVEADFSASDPASGFISVDCRIADSSAAEVRIAVLDRHDHLLTSGETDVHGQLELTVDNIPQPGDSLICWISGRNIVPRKIVLQIPVAVKPANEFAISPIYPNPFNPEAELTFHLPRKGRITATVVDLQGRKVKTLVRREFSAGYHTLRIDGREMSTGVYICVVKTPQNVHSQKMILIK